MANYSVNFLSSPPSVSSGKKNITCFLTFLKLIEIKLYKKERKCNQNCIQL